MLAALADDDLASCAMAEARLTHHDPVAGEVAAAANKLCRALVRGDGWDVALRQVLERSLAFAGPSNYCPVLVGAVAGARWGDSAVPPPALAHVDILPRVKATADALAAGWAREAR